MWKNILPSCGIALLIAVWLSVSPSPAHAAAEKPPSILITEVVVDSPGTSDAYRYIELYNNTARSINLADLQILYYWQATASTPWTNSSATAYSITSAGRPNDMYIRPYSTKVVWLLSDPSKGVADFNSVYGSTLGEKDFVYLESTSGWAFTNQRYFSIAKSPYNKDADRITFVRYNEAAGTGNCSGAGCDFVDGESVEYYYPSVFNTTSREMDRRNPGSYHRTPTPGQVTPEQVPTPPGKLLITEAMINSPDAADAFRYLEIYNNSPDPIDLTQQKIMYYWQPSASSPWETSSVDTYSIFTRGTDPTSKTIQPYSTKIVWFLSDSAKTVAQFNSTYGTSLAENAFVYIQGNGWSHTGQRHFAILAAPYDKSINRHSFVRYNAGAGLGTCSGSACDFGSGQSVHYFAPTDFNTDSREMVRKSPDSFRQPGTPGTLSSWQAPPRPVTQVSMSFSTTKDTVNYDEFFSLSTAGPLIPGLDQDYIQQGMDYYPAKDWILISYYHDGGQPSVIAIVERTSGNFVKAVKLFKDATTPYTEHAAGVAVSNTHAWVSSWKHAYQLKLADLDNAQHMDTVVFSDIIELENKGGSLGYANGILWVGEYGRYNYTTDPSHHMTNRVGQKHEAWMAGFILNGNDTIDKTRMRAGTNEVVPNYLLSIPDEIQGVDVIGDKFILSKSYGPQYDSDLLIFELDLTDTPHATTSRFGSPNVPIWFLDNQNLLKSLMMPPQSEAVFAYGGQIYVSFESASPKFTSTTTYPSIYPLERIYLVDANSLVNATPPAQVDPGALLMTETVLSSTGGNAYRYIELYNNSGQTIDLTDHRITEHWKHEETKPWQYELFQYKLYDAGRGSSMTIAPGDTKIVWVLSDPSKTIADFNSHYGTSWAADKFVYIKAGISGEKERMVGIIGALGSKDVDRYSMIRYNVGLGNVACIPGTNCDASAGESIVYYYPSTFDPVSRLMERRNPASLRQTPTPGTLVTGQIP